MLPPELGSLQDPEDEATEYMHYRQFFGVWETLARVVECAALEQPQMNKESRASWLADYRVRRPPPLSVFRLMLMREDALRRRSSSRRASRS